MGECEGLRIPTFEEAVNHIVDPEYGLGLPWLWQLSREHPFHKPACIHDLRYDYLIPGEDTLVIDAEFMELCRIVLVESPEFDTIIYAVERQMFYGLARVHGVKFTSGIEVCAYRKYHEWRPCTYGQLKIFDLRCRVCGLHKPLGT